MSFRALLAVREVRGISPTARLVLFGLAQYAGPDGLCHPSQETLAGELGLSRKSVTRAMAELKDTGLIATARRCRKNGSRTSDQISLLYYTPAEVPEPDARLAESRRDKRAVRTESEEIDQGTDCPFANRAEPQSQQGRRPDNDQGTDCPIAKGTNSAGLGDSLSHPTTFEPVSESTERESKVSLSERARDVFADALAAYPRSGAVVTDESRARAAWEAAVREAGTEERLLVAVQRYAADPTERKRPHGAPSMHRWLGENRFRPWLADADAQAPELPIVPGRWPGPPEIRAAIAAAIGEAATISYLDPGSWRDADRVILARTGVARERLQREARAVLAEHQLTVTLAPSTAHG